MDGVGDGRGSESEHERAEAGFHDSPEDAVGRASDDSFCDI